MHLKIFFGITNSTISFVFSFSFCYCFWRKKIWWNIFNLLKTSSVLAGEDQLISGRQKIFKILFKLVRKKWFWTKTYFIRDYLFQFKTNMIKAYEEAILFYHAFLKDALNYFICKSRFSWKNSWPVLLNE